MLSKGLKVKIQVSKYMVEDGFIPVSFIPDVIKKVENYHQKVFVTDMEGKSVFLDPVINNGILMGFYIDVDIPKFSHISLMLFLEDN